jgi:carbamoyl-phosphate synthase small subunit
MNQQPAILVLADGTVFEGESIGAEGFGAGELVFNTSMTGYQEMLTDPSYARQLITLTVAHVGNTGCNALDAESTRVWASGLVVRHASFSSSNYRSEQHFPEWLKRNGVVAIAGIDTRYLTLRLRDSGAIGACVSTDVTAVERARALAISEGSLSGIDLTQTVTIQSPVVWNGSRGEWGNAPLAPRFHVVAYDFGIKQTILHELHERGCKITLVPATFPPEAVHALKPDGIFLSNGPGDPSACEYGIATARFFLEQAIPVFGICFGFQLLGLALGGKTFKMKFGHHGANHPVIETSHKKQVFITSQNHGFAVDESTLPSDVEITHRSLFDGTLQGFRHREKPVYGFQGHPEASPGPHDIAPIFELFIQHMAANNL